MLSKFPILSIETSQSCCGACVFFDDTKFFEMSVNFNHSHAEKIYNIIDTVIKSSEISLKDLSAIALSCGPGSFTGLRIGMSAAKGLAFGASLPIIPVPTFEALAFQISKGLTDGTEFIIANKVNSEEAYFAKFKVISNNYIFTKDLQIVKSTDDILTNQNCLVYGNVSFTNVPAEKILSISYPSPVFIAKWARCFSNDDLRLDFDYLEPNYLKEFIVKEKIK